MKTLMIAVLAVAVAVFFAPRMASIGGSEAWAVKPPSQESRDKAEAGHEKEKAARAKVVCESGCPYGKDKITKKCYQPKEGQVYVDCKTGDVKMMKTTCVNLPWKPCGGGTPAEKPKEKSKEKPKSKDKSSSGGDTKPAAKAAPAKGTGTGATAAGADIR